MNYKHLVIFLTCCSLIACSSSSSPYSRSYTSTQKTKSSLPKVPARVMPGGDNDSWRYLGTTDNGSIGIEINDASISNQGNNQYKYQDRKTIINQNDYPYNGTPSYKYSLSWWLMDCGNSRYIINSTALYDAYGKPLRSYNFNQTQFSNVASGSISEAQFNYICNGTKKNVGY